MLSTWVKHLYGLVDQLNDMEMQMTGTKPEGAAELKKLPSVHGQSYLSEDTLPEDGSYGLLQPGEEHNDQHKRTTDRIWSKKTYRMSEILVIE